jgi:hypothetical protein
VTPENPIEAQIAEWRDYLRRRQAIHATDVTELEDHLRAQIAALAGAGLTEDESFLVAVRRLGNLDALSREFAREHSERLWKQLLATDEDGEEASARNRREPWVVLALAIAAALAFKVPELFGQHMTPPNPAVEAFYARNACLFVLPLLTGYLVWKRRSGTAGMLAIVASFAAAALFANVYPLAPGGATLLLTATHLPIALWLAVGVAYVGGRWRRNPARMDFVRFSGELFIYYALIALGGGVLTGFVAFMFRAIGLDVGSFLGLWLVPCGALGAIPIAAWLVETKKSVIENMAPVLTRLFTPLFTVLLLAFLATMAWTRNGITVDRDVLIGFDLLLAVVLGLVVYTVSARDPDAPPGAFDALQLLLVVCALVVDGIALAAIAARISAFGWSPNKVAALGENVVLLGNLVWTAWLYARFLRRRGSFGALERWQMAYLPVYALWAWCVVAAFPPLFGFR